MVRSLWADSAAPCPDPRSPRPAVETGAAPAATSRPSTPPPPPSPSSSPAHPFASSPLSRPTAAQQSATSSQSHRGSTGVSWLLACCWLVPGHDLQRPLRLLCMSWSTCFPASHPKHLDETCATLSKASTIITSRLVPQQLRCLVAPRSRIILQKRVLLQLLPPP